MPFIEKQDKTKLEPVNYRLRPEVVADLELYAKFLDESEPSWVVQETLRKVFAQDKEFQRWKAEAARATGRGSKPPSVVGDSKSAVA